MTEATLKPGGRAYGLTPPAGKFVRWYPAARWAAGMSNSFRLPRTTPPPPGFSPPNAGGPCRSPGGAMEKAKYRGPISTRGASLTRTGRRDGAGHRSRGRRRNPLARGLSPLPRGRPPRPRADAATAAPLRGRRLAVRAAPPGGRVPRACRRAWYLRPLRTCSTCASTSPRSGSASRYRRTSSARASPSRTAARSW